jgi:hypothetical protein
MIVTDAGVLVGAAPEDWAQAKVEVEGRGVLRVDEFERTVLL